MTVIRRETLKETIAQYRSKNSETLTAEEQQTLTCLEGNSDARAAWLKFGARPQVDLCAALSIILENKSLAPFNKRVPDMKASDAERFASLQAAADLLTAHYAEAPLLANHLADDSGMQRRVSTYNQDLKAARASLVWITESVRASAKTVQQLHSLAFPSSQKRNEEGAERKAFQIMMSIRLESYFNQPFDDFVTTISAALYPSNKDITVESVKKARGREKSARSSPTN